MTSSPRVAIHLAFVLSCVVACKHDETSGSPAPGASAGPAPKHLSSGLCPAFGATCGSSELDPYNACVDQKCDAEQMTCYGADYRKGVPGGPCAEWIKCHAACRCDDVACLRKCSSTKACMDCMTSTLHPCLAHAGCFVPPCADIGAP